MIIVLDTDYKVRKHKENYFFFFPFPFSVPFLGPQGQHGIVNPPFKSPSVSDTESEITVNNESVNLLKIYIDNYNLF